MVAALLGLSFYSPRSAAAFGLNKAVRLTGVSPQQEPQSAVFALADSAQAVLAVGAALAAALQQPAGSFSLVALVSFAGFASSAYATTAKAAKVRETISFFIGFHP